MFYNLLNFMKRFALYVSAMCTNFFYFLNEPISELIVNSDIGQNQFMKPLIDLVEPYLNHFSLLEFMTVNITAILAITIIRWLRGMIR